MTSLRFLFFAAIASSTVLSGENEPLSTLTFADGDSISGSPIGMEIDKQDRSIIWKSDHLVKDEHPFYESLIDTIRFNSRSFQLPSSTATITFQAHLDGGNDVLKGNLKSFNDETLTLDTWYAGELVLQRNMLKDIEIASSSTLLVDGFGRKNSWVRSGAASEWSIEGKVVDSSSRGSIAREFNFLPPKVVISFQVNYEYSPSFQIHFFADEGDAEKPANGYYFDLSSRDLNFFKRIDKKPIRLGERRLGARGIVNRAQSSEVSLYLDRGEGVFALYVDGQEASKATDDNVFQEGHWLHIASTGNRDQSIRKLQIREWNGELPSTQAFIDPEGLPDLEGEVIKLRNGDSIIGKVMDIADGKLNVSTKYLEMAIPIEKIRTFEVSQAEKLGWPRMYQNDIRAFFVTGGHVTLKVSELTSETITGYSQVFGESTFELKAFSRIEFNPHSLPFRALRGQAE